MEFMKPETLEAIKKEVEMSPVEWLEKEVKKRFGGETFTSVFSVEFERSKKMENDIIEGATKYASLLESEREKSEKLCEAVKSLLLISCCKRLFDQKFLVLFLLAELYIL